jgi:hypothetical protein
VSYVLDRTHQLALGLKLCILANRDGNLVELVNGLKSTQIGTVTRKGHPRYGLGFSKVAGSHYVEWPDGPWLDLPADQVTMVWAGMVKDSSAAYYAGHDPGGGPQAKWFWGQHGGPFSLPDDIHIHFYPSTTTWSGHQLADGAPGLVAFSRWGAAWDLYINGQFRSTVTNASAFGSVAGGTTLKLGYAEGGVGLSGDSFLFRLYHVPKSRGWHALFHKDPYADIRRAAWASGIPAGVEGVFSYAGSGTVHWQGAAITGAPSIFSYVGEGALYVAGVAETLTTPPPSFETVGSGVVRWRGEASTIFQLPPPTPIPVPRDDQLNEVDLISFRWATGDRGIINRVLIEYDWDATASTFTKRVLYEHTESIRRYGPRPPLTISSTGLQTSAASTAFLDARVTDVFKRFGNGPAPVLQVETFYRRHAWDAGDIVGITSSHIPNLLRGERAISDEAFELVDCRPQFGDKGRLVATLVDVEAMTDQPDPFSVRGGGFTKLLLGSRRVGPRARTAPRTMTRKSVTPTFVTR